MREAQSRDVIIQAMLGNACGSLLRLLGDIERFGLCLKSLILENEGSGHLIATFGLSIPCDADARFIATRFARHLDIVSVAVHRDGGIRSCEPTRADGDQSFVPQPA